MVSTVELFFDLVFVFIITQLTGSLTAHLDVVAVLHMLVLLGVTWWMYGGYAWLTNHVPPSTTTRRTLLLVGMVGFLVMALAIPDISGDAGWAFGLGYFVVNAVHTGLFALGGRTSRVGLRQLAPLNLVSACLVLGGGLGPVHARFGLWTAAVALQIASPYLHQLGSFRIEAEHFAERHGLLIIIALGESIVAIGVGAAGHEVDLGVIVVAVAGLIIAYYLYWTYFGGDDTRARHALAAVTDPVRRARLSMSAYGYLHYPMLVAVILTAAGVKKATGHAFEPISRPASLALAGGAALFLLAHAWFRRLMDTGGIGYRVVAAAACLATVPLGLWCAAAQLGGMALALSVPLSIEGYLRLRADRSASGTRTRYPRRMPSDSTRRVALLTLGCARNEVDSEELAARLADGGWEVSTDGTDADVVLVNTCGFVAKAKQDSIDTLLAAADTGAKVVATGCLAERYGEQLAGELPEADAVLGFDHYPDMAARLDAVLAGDKIASHTPRDRRTLLPLTPVARQAAPSVVVPGHTPAHLRTVFRQRLASGPVAPLKLASGCDRRCSFCAIPTFRGAFVSRTPDEVLAEAEWLASTGVRELVLVSENSTSYGKDLGDPRLLERLLPQLAAVSGIVRVRVSYLQPAETRPGLVEAIATTPGVAPYFDLSFQHSSEPVLRRMRRFGSTERFLELLDSARALDPLAGARSNVIVGFPGETQEDVEELARFLTEARLDAVGVFDYSDEDGTEAADLPDKVDEDTVQHRYEWMSALAEELCAQRAEDRVGEVVEVLVDTIDRGDGDGDEIEGRAAHQAPEVDGSTTLISSPFPVKPGDLVRAKVTQSVGVDLVAVPLEMISAAAGS